MREARPNDPCPCGSGRKYKKCCGVARGKRLGATPAPTYTREDRAAATELLFGYIEDVWGDVVAGWHGDFCGPYLDRVDSLPDELWEGSRGAFEGWFAFDRRLPDGRRLVDCCIADTAPLAPQRRFLETMAATSYRLYRVIDKLPGVSVTLRDLIEDETITVAERTASYGLSRGTTLAARVVPAGASGKPELESGPLQLSGFGVDEVIAAVKASRDARRAMAARLPLADAYADAPRIVHQAWLGSIFEPRLPELRNTDGEALVWTRIRFDAATPGPVAEILNQGDAEGLESSGDDTWSWSKQDARGRPLSLGTLRLGGGTLTLETNSAARAERGRALLERLLGELVTHRSTTHTGIERAARDRYTASLLGEPPDAAPTSEPELSHDVQDAVVMQLYAEHYRAWLDEPVPALGDKTPREAAADTALRPRLLELLREGEALYERALLEGQPAYDGSWMWQELGLSDPDDLSHPPPLAHERVAERDPGCAEACRALAERIRARHDFDDTSTLASAGDIDDDLALQRILRGKRGDAGASEIAPYVPLLVDLELHRRKVFWCDAALAFMLESTDVDIAGTELRAPFPSVALVFADRHTLSFGERLLSRRPKDPQRGQILRVITVFVTERRDEGGAALKLTFALDALGADLPSLVDHEVPVDSDEALQAYLASLGEVVVMDPPVLDANPARALLRVALNACRYATSAGVEAAERRPPEAPPARRASHREAPRPSRETVYHLPGKIDIRTVRDLQKLRRAPGGHPQLARFLVRGHWRRAQAGWSDQRPRWIAPYWKGPDLGTVIERAYRLRP